MITYIQTANRDTTCLIWYTKIYLISIHDNLHSNSTQRDTTCLIWYTKIYLISIHDNLHSNSTQRHNMFYMVY
jgi:hypothetical protein